MTRRDAHRYLIAYDIADDRRRTRVSAALKEVGDRIQYSVFVVDASRVRIERVRRALAVLILPTQDSVLFCDVGPVSEISASRFTLLGVEKALTDEDSFVV